MEIYRLSPIGYKLSKSIKYEDKPEWHIIHFLARQHSASKEKIMQNVAGVTSRMLAKLRLKGAIVEETGVTI